MLIDDSPLMSRSRRAHHSITLKRLTLVTHLSISSESRLALTGEAALIRVTLNLSSLDRSRIKALKSLQLVITLAARVAIATLRRTIFLISLVHDYFTSKSISSTLPPGGVIGKTLSSGFIAHCKMYGPSVSSISRMAASSSPRSTTVRQGML